MDTNSKIIGESALLSTVATLFENGFERNGLTTPTDAAAGCTEETAADGAHCSAPLVNARTELLSLFNKTWSAARERMLEDHAYANHTGSVESDAPQGAAAQKATLTGPQASVTDSGEPAHSDDAAPAADAIDDPLNPRRLA